MLLGVAIFTFLSTLIGRLSGKPDIAVVLAGLFCVWAFLMAMNDLETAEKYFPPLSIKAIIRTHKARVNLCLGNTDTALEQAQEAVTELKMPVILSTLGLILTRLKKFDEALQTLNLAIEIDQLYAEA